MSESITVAEAKKLWDEIYPGNPISRQSIINWCVKNGLGGKMEPCLRTGKININREKFVEYIKNLKK